MSKPGPMDWATNDTWVGGPDVGTETKAASGVGNQQEGYYPGVMPSPQILNWELNRLGLLRDSVCRAHMSNHQDWPSSFATANLSVLHAFAYNQAGVAASPIGIPYVFFTDPAAGFAGVSYVGYSLATGLYDPWGTAGTCNQAVANPVDIDADGSHDQQVVVVTQVAGGGHLRISNAGAAFAAPTVTPPPVPGPPWARICCDRDTYGNGWSHWMVGSRPGGGACQIYEAVNSPPNTWAANAAFNALAIAEDIDCIHHSRHPQYATAPDDTGNPVWLAITPSFAVRSTNDGAAWTSAAHGLVGNFGPRSVSYSRTHGRFVMPVGNAAGDVAYSDDNGATWTTVAGAIVSSGTKPMEIAGDGYGCFVVGERGVTTFGVSVDGGLTWSNYYTKENTNGGIDLVGEMQDSSVNIDDTPPTNDGCVTMHYNVAGAMSVWHTIGS